MSTDFLFARPSVWSGAARLFDLFGTFDSYNISPTPEEADRRAMFSDFWMVGEDLMASGARFGAEHPEIAQQTEPAQHSFVFAEPDPEKRLGA